MRRTAVPLILIALTQAAAAAPATSPIDTDAVYAHPHQLVDIGGRRLNLYCSGSGPVTVVFDAQGGDAGWSWHRVHPRVAARTRACVYDRAGLGFSDLSPLPATTGNAVDDLHALLAKAGVAPPYVLVGNSSGGAQVQLYTYRYPDEVNALVLVEAGHEDETERVNAASQGKLKQMYAMQDAFQAKCADAAAAGFDRAGDLFGACTGGMWNGYGRELAAARLAMATGPDFWRTILSESASGDTSDAELRAARRSFGDLPLVVLARGVSPFAIPGRPQSALNKATEAANLATQKEMAGLSTRSSLHVVAGAGHIIQQDKPDAVVNAVFESLDSAGF
jgi:pimeloyl-ACP methyl ester carboxylesterase